MKTRLGEKHPRGDILGEPCGATFDFHWTGVNFDKDNKNKKNTWGFESQFFICIPLTFPFFLPNDCSSLLHFSITFSNSKRSVFLIICYFCSLSLTLSLPISLFFSPSPSPLSLYLCFFFLSLSLSLFFSIHFHYLFPLSFHYLFSLSKCLILSLSLSQFSLSLSKFCV